MYNIIADWRCDHSVHVLLSYGWWMWLWTYEAVDVCSAVSGSSAAEDEKHIEKRSAAETDVYDWQVPVDAASKRAPSFRLGKRLDSDYMFDDVERRAPTFRLGKRLDDKRAPSFRLGKRAPSFRLGWAGSQSHDSVMTSVVRTYNVGSRWSCEHSLLAQFWQRLN